MSENNSQLGIYKKMKSELKKLKEAGFKLTPQRQAILEVLRSSGMHMSADEIHEKVKKRCSQAGLATTYRTLDLFKELNLVTDINLGEGHKHYELKRKNHYHLVCRECGEIMEFRPNISNKMERGLLKNYGFKVIDYHVEFYGYCSKCLKKGEN
ncbi:Fur family transcriptional regulator [Candidatus Oleimmundimicrobium sp.]|uniref:Fur family transcriptional regulator n=1 Tax=Candidatus Oleimmundimicrobium sp. TaxID=3060597 RepID=UPI0027167F7E|nr:Fur family transcriptional regulator [Candidatus Oleimmundimicrobium sp.]MDO8886609.1 Fur family transcriptional regulator [Candidatus Oleimmundimicrobium sp.]